MGELVRLLGASCPVEEVTKTGLGPVRFGQTHVLQPYGWQSLKLTVATISGAELAQEPQLGSVPVGAKLRKCHNRIVHHRSPLEQDDHRAGAQVGCQRLRGRA